MGCWLIRSLVECMWFWLGVWWCGWFVGCGGRIVEEVRGVWEYVFCLGDEIIGDYKIDVVGVRVK